MHHLLLHSGRQVLYVDPCAREVFPPEAERAVLRRTGQHRAGRVPGYAPHIGLGGALHRLRRHVLQGAVFSAVQFVNLMDGGSIKI